MFFMLLKHMSNFMPIKYYLLFVGTFYAFGPRLFVEGKGVGPDSFSIEFVQNQFVYKTRQSKKRETSNIYIYIYIYIYRYICGTPEMNVNPNNLLAVRHRVIQP